MKKIQKEYERKIKINQNNDVFTMFQRSSHPDHSPNLHHQQKTISAHQTQHQNIESLKSTLKSLVPASMDLNRPFSKSGILTSNDLKDSNKNDDYMLKLDNLTKNLQEIASKCHFSPANPDSSIRERAFSNKDVRSKISYENSQAISRYEPMNQESVFKYSNNASMELPSRNRSFVDKDSAISNHSKSRSKKKQEGSLKNVKHSYNYDKSREQSSKKKSFSKNEVVVDMLQNPNNSKNLTKIFQSYDNTYPDLFKRRDRSQSKQPQYQTLLNQKVHRHRITSILVTDQIYTSSLDYTIKRVYEEDGGYRSETIQKYRGGVQHIALVNGTIFGCGKDGYIRSLDGNYFYRCDSTPVSISESDRSNLVHLTLQSRQLRLFDLDKRIAVSSLHFETEFSPLLKNNKQMFVASNHALFGIDWRKKDYLISLYKDTTKRQCHWLSDPYSNTFWLQSNRQLTILSPQFRKIKTKWLPQRSQFATYYWNRKNLNVLVTKDEGHHLIRYAEGQEFQQVDSESSATRIGLMIVRQKLLIYAGKEGDLIIKQLNR